LQSIAHIGLKTAKSEFATTYAVNTTIMYYAAIAFHPLLDAGNEKSKVRSQIIATSSICGFSRLSGASVTYSNSKAAVRHMIKTMAMAFAPYRIR
jgi:NAD(P)-dependent dehydrogenase (short-subunit alcohol dehydrogenase family)